jgi:predicted nucleic acid-binding protein
MAVSFELRNNPNAVSRAAIMKFYASTVNETVNLTYADFMRARSLQAEGVGAMDSQHLVAAEIAGASYLLTVDDDFERIVTKKNLSKVIIMNPLTYLAGGMI